MSTLLFKSGFESATAKSAPTSFYSVGAWENWSGTDAVSGFAWPGNVWSGGIRTQLHIGIPVNAGNIGNYAHDEIQTVTGHLGGSTQALYQELTSRPSGDTQIILVFEPTNENSDLYVKFWVKFQSNFLATHSPPAFKELFGWKTTGDYRIIVAITSASGTPVWRCVGDNNANGGLPFEEFWRVDFPSLPVPIDTWMKVETFTHRANDANGRFWAAIDDTVICDHFGDNIGVNSNPINRVFLPNLYQGSNVFPLYQWVDDLEIWDGFPVSLPVYSDPDIVGTPDQYDTFNRADNAASIGTPSDSGNAWEILFGAFGILTNKAYQPTTLASVAVRQFTSANVEISAQLYGPGDNVGIIGRVADVNNYILLVFTPSILRIYKVDAGVFTQLATSGTLSFFNGDTITLRMTADNFLEGLHNGVSVVSTTNSFGSSNTKHGIRGDITTTGVFNNFTVTDIGEPQPAPITAGGFGGLD